jgi:hypothetical protein
MTPQQKASPSAPSLRKKDKKRKGRRRAKFSLTVLLSNRSVSRVGERAGLSSAKTGDVVFVPAEVLSRRPVATSASTSARQLGEQAGSGSLPPLQGAGRRERGARLT